MKTSEEGIALIKKFEGCELSSYICAGGVPTIGYGHTKDVKTEILAHQSKRKSI